MSVFDGIKANEKPLSNKMSFVYAENEEKEFVRVSKDWVKKILGIATNLSELNNDVGFVDKLVSDLKNYYTKNEIEDKLSLVPRFSVQVVTNLPTENISETTVYLVPAGEDENNLYTEYINVDGLWEILGSQKLAKIELNKEEIESALGYVPADAEKVAQIELDLNEKLSETELELAIEDALRQAKESGEFNGTDGISIKSIAKTSTEGLVDIYTITFTNEKKAAFTVTNGKDGRGIKSIEKTSSNGNIDTYTITFTDDTKFTYNVVNASSDSGGIVAETDPTVPSWAKQPTKPSYTAEEVGALPNTTKIPVNTSDLNNDNEFITKTVTDLVNYYTKSQSYSKDEIDNKLSAIPKFSIQPVEQLPTSNISETTVYLLKTGEETNNLYTEYIYVGGKWEYLGKQTIDLSGYALKTELPTKLSDLTNDAGFITNTVSDLVNYYSKSETYSKAEIDAKGFLTEHQDLSDYAKKNEVPENLSQLKQDSTHRVVTDSQVETWNNKSNFSGNYDDLTNKPTIPSKTSQLANDSNFAVKEDIPTELPASDVYDWAKQPKKPTYSASEVGALPSTTKVPDKTSDLTNDSGFITKAVNDLANYYLKSQTYSAEEIDNKISTIPKFSIEVVESLPTTNISNTTVYLIASGNEQDNLYTEYIYVNSKWEYLGKQTVDLSGYVKRTELSSYYTKTEIDSLLQTIRSSIPTKLSQMTEDATHRTVTDTEKQTWNNKSNFSGNYNDLENKPNIPTKVDFIDDDLTILCDHTFNPENCKTLHLAENNLVNNVFVKAVRSIPVIIRLRNMEWGEVVDADCILADGEDATLLISFNVSAYPNGEKFIVTIKMSGDELNNGYTGTLRNVTIEEHASKESVSKLEEQIADQLPPHRNTPRKPQTVIVNDCQDSTTYKGSGITANTTDQIMGSQCVNVAGKSAYIRFTKNVFDVKNNHLVIKVRINNLDANVQLYVKMKHTTSDENYAQYVVTRYVNANNTIFGEWREYTIPYTSINSKKNIDALDFTKIDDIFVGVNDNSGGSGTGNFDIQFIGLRPNTQSKGIVSFAFDDGFKTQYDGIKILAERGLTGTIYHIKTDGNTNYLTTDELKELVEYYGADIEVHNSNEYQNMSNEELIAHWTEYQRFLKENGLSEGRHMAYPGGSHPTRVVELARKYFDSCRTIEELIHGETYPPYDNYRMRAVSSVNDSNKAKIKEYIDDAVEGKIWLILVFHKIETGDGSSICCPPTTLAELADYAIASGARIMNIAEVFETNGGGSGVDIGEIINALPVYTGEVE